MNKSDLNTSVAVSDFQEKTENAPAFSVPNSQTALHHLCAICKITTVDITSY